MKSDVVTERAEAVTQAAERLRADGVVCVFGPPGVGKAGFARAIAAPSRLVVVNARGSSDPGALRRAMAAATGVSWDGEDPRELHAMLSRGEPMTLWLEDVDELATQIGEEVASLFGEADALTIITTSMQRLGTPFDFELKPLPTRAARALFVRCATQAMPGYAPDDTELQTIDELLTALDCLPLAIELAASRRPLLSPRDILERLDARFELLRERRGRALENAVGWAWELLDDELRDALVRLSVFAAPFRLASAEAILGCGTAAAVDLVEELRDRCLLRVATPVAGESRFELYETVRGYVREQGDEIGVAAHAATFIAEAKSAIERLDRGGDASLERLAAIVPELDAVMQRAATHDVTLAALLLDRIFARTGTDVVRRHALNLALDLALEPPRRARLLLARAMCGVDAGSLEDATDDLRAALDAAQNTGDAEIEARAMFRAGDVARRRGEVADALFLLAQALDLAPSDDLRRLTRAHLACCQVDHGMHDAAREAVSEVERGAQAESLVVECEVRRRLAYVHFYLGNYAEQHRQGVVALDAANQAQHARLQALCEQGLGDSATVLGKLDDGREAYERALQMHRRLGDVHYEGVLLGNLGTVHHRQGRLDDAAMRYREALAIHRRTGARPYEAVVAMSLGLLEAERGRVSEAEHHLAASASISEALGLHDDVGAASLGRGWGAVRVGDLAQAQEQFEAAATAFERGDAPAWQAIARYLAGGVSDSSAAETVAQYGGDTERELLAAAQRWRGDRADQPSAARSLHVRLANAAVRSAGAAPPAASPTSTRLRIAHDGSWFDAGPGRVDLRRRRAHRLLLMELVRRYHSDAAPLDVFDAFDVGWPDEKAGAEAAADRVYWVVGTLRRLGLKDVLITADAGYLLAPGAEIVSE